MKQNHARKITSSEDQKDPCAHPLCRDMATYYERRTRQKPLPHCRAHHLEFKYLQHVARQRARPKPPSRRVLMPCGTPAAAARHRRRKEPVCDPCREADNARTADWKARHR